MLKTKMTWAGGMKFEAKSNWGFKIVADSAESVGGTESGAKPTELLLYAVAACSGMDVVSLLKKMRQEMTSLEIEVNGLQGDEYPKPFHTIEMKYIVGGKNLDKSKIEKAINMSQDKYCTVSQTLKGVAEFKVTIEYLD